MVDYNGYDVYGEYINEGYDDYKYERNVKQNTDDDNSEARYWKAYHLAQESDDESVDTKPDIDKEYNLDEYRFDEDQECTYRTILESKTHIEIITNKTGANETYVNFPLKIPEYPEERFGISHDEDIGIYCPNIYEIFKDYISEHVFCDDSFYIVERDRELVSFLAKYFMKIWFSTNNYDTIKEIYNKKITLCRDLLDILYDDSKNIPEDKKDSWIKEKFISINQKLSDSEEHKERLKYINIYYKDICEHKLVYKKKRIHESIRRHKEDLILYEKYSTLFGEKIENIKF
jgi:hypothetical protein